MDQGQEIAQRPTCVLCGTQKGGYNFYHNLENQDICLCVDCLKGVSKSLDDDQLSHMTVAQLRRYMEVRDKLASAYKDSFVATRTFCVGKRRNVPILEVDESRRLWALPKARMPLAQSISSIVDVEVTLSSEGLDEAEGMSEEIVEGVKLKDLLPFLRGWLSLLYKSKHVDLAPIPEGHFVNYLKMVLTLDDQESGLDKVEIDLLPFWISWPSCVTAGYDCAYEVIEFLRRLAQDDYERRKATTGSLDLSCNARLSELAEKGLIDAADAEVLRYYLERMPPQGSVEAMGSSYGLVKAAVDTVVDCLVFGEKAPDLQTQHTVGTETFLGAFNRYAPGLSVGDVVYLMDKTRIQSGKSGLLFAQDSFAVDDFALGLDESAGLSQPIPYDDLLYMARGEGKGQLVLAYMDGRRIKVNGGKFAHFIFAAVNCIVLLRAR